MATIFHPSDLPDSKSPNLCLSHGTWKECLKICINTYAEWGDSLTLPEYVKEAQFLANAPLARDGGMTTWVLTEKDPLPNDRPIYASCESFRKQSLISDPSGNTRDVIVYGIASVFCPMEYRRRGYTARMLTGLSKELFHWQAEAQSVVGSILYSDIGKRYYADLGWHPAPTNSHIEFKPVKQTWFPLAKPILEAELGDLCQWDEAMVHKAMAVARKATENRVAILPNLEHMLWHIAKEEFSTNHLFGKIPAAKGAIAGQPGRRVWILWAHRYYGRHDAQLTNNVLFVLRLAMEGDRSANGAVYERDGNCAWDAERMLTLMAVLQAAQDEAAQWQLDRVKPWNPSPHMEEMIKVSGFEHGTVERQHDSISSGLWYDEDGDISSAPLWLNNEHYAWC